MLKAIFKMVLVELLQKWLDKLKNGAEVQTETLMKTTLLSSQVASPTKAKRSRKSVKVENVAENQTNIFNQ